MGRQLLVMRENKTLYGLWADQVLEVQTEAVCTPLPKPLDYYEGVSNYKGNIIPVFSLTHISGSEDRQNRESDILVVAESQRGVIALMTEEVVRVIEDTEKTMPLEDLNLEEGVLQLQEIICWQEPILVLDLEGILAKLSLAYEK